MPSKSKSQHNFMAAVANSPSFAKKVGIKQSVGEEFMKADKGRKFGSGGMSHSEKGEMKADVKQDKAMIKKAVGMHDKQLHGGKKTNLASLKKGGVAKTVTKEMEYDYKTGKKSFPGTTAQKDMHAEKEGKRVAKDLAYDKAMGMCGGGKAKGYAAGGRIASKGEHPVQTKSKRGAEMVKMATGGYVRKADGIAKRGLTRGAEPKMMKKGGKC